MRRYKNYLFDFGGVLYKINITNALMRFRNFSDNKAIFDNKNDSFLINDQSIDLYEKGIISTEDFRSQIKKRFALNLSDNEFDESWNSILIEKYSNATDMIRSLSSIADIRLLSNTSPLHHQYFSKECKEMFSLFKTLYFSFEIGIRKPDPKAFEYVIEHSNWLPEETLFVDDTQANIETAAALGFKTLKVETPEILSDLLHSV
jgi:glucose-1-phosphatase